MIKKKSAGLLVYRKINDVVEIFLVHPGGPYYKNKDDGFWSIPKGEFLDDETPLRAAIREFTEETGISINGDFKELHPVVIKSGKKIYAWMIEKNFDADKIISNHFEMEWPPKSGKMQSFPEVDKGGWFEKEIAKRKINAGQVPLIIEFEKAILSGYKNNDAVN